MRGRWRWALVLLFLIVGVEVTLRILGTGVPPTEFCPDGAARGDFRYEPRLRSGDQGFNPQKRTILCFGDGWSYGLGVSESITWPRRLEYLLQQRDDSFRVINLARPENTSAEVAGQFHRSLVKYQPEKAVVFIGLQDATPRSLLNQYPLPDPNQGQSCRRPSWRLLAILKIRYRAWRWSLEPIDPPENKEFLDRRLAVYQTLNYLQTIRQEAEQAGVELVFITYPELNQQDDPRPHLPLEHRNNYLIRQAAADSPNVKLYDLGDRLRNAPAAEYLLPWMLWPHPNDDLHFKIAVELAKVL